VDTWKEELQRKWEGNGFVVIFIRVCYLGGHNSNFHHIIFLSNFHYKHLKKMGADSYPAPPPMILFNPLQRVFRSTGELRIEPTILRSWIGICKILINAKLLYNLTIMIGKTKSKERKMESMSCLSWW
jgi:hypothetical protein